MRDPRRILTTFVVVGLFSTGVLSPKGAVFASSCTKPYVAVDNDSWSRIAGKTGVTLKQLLKTNKATTKSMILVGDTICLPESSTYRAPDTEQTGLHLPTPRVRYTRAQSAAAIKAVFPARLQARAIALAKRESKLNAASYTWCCVGLFQINWWAHKPWLKDLGITKASQLLDPEANARAAFTMYKRSGGWSPWDM